MPSHDNSIQPCPPGIRYGVASNCIARALSRTAENAIELAPDLQPVLGKLLECGVVQETREFIGPAHEPTPIQKCANAMEEVEANRCSGQVMIKEVRHINADDRLS